MWIILAIAVVFMLLTSSLAVSVNRSPVSDQASPSKVNYSGNNNLDSFLFPYVPKLNNYSIAVQGTSTQWISTVGGLDNSFLLGASSGFIGVSINGSIFKMTSFPQGTQPQITGDGNSFLFVGAGVMSDGGVESFKYYPTNKSLLENVLNLPYSWTFPGNGTYIETLSNDNGTLFFVEESVNQNVPISIDLYNNNKMINITSKFPLLSPGRFASAYGGGYFLLLSGTANFLYNVTTGTVRNLSKILSPVNIPLYNNVVQWNGTSFILMNNNNVISYNPSTNISRTLYVSNTGQITFITTFGKYYTFGLNSGERTTIFEGNGSNTVSAYNLWGYITDAAFCNNTFAFTGQGPGQPTVLYIATDESISGNITLNVSPAEGTQILINGQLYSTNNGKLVLNNTPNGKYDILAYNVYYDYFFKQYQLNGGNLTINITLNNSESGIVNTFPWEQVGPYRAMLELSNNTVEKTAGHFGKIAVYDNNPEIIYGITGPGMTLGFGPFGDGGIYKTVNGGLTWDPIDFGLPFGSLLSLVLNQSNPNELLLSVSQFGVYKTVDGGQYWFKVSNITNVTNFVEIGNVIYAGFGNGFPGSSGGILKITGFGQNFTVLKRFNTSVIHISVSSDHFYALLSNNTLYSDFQGNILYYNNWTFQQGAAITPSTVTASPFNPNMIFATFGSSVGISYGFVSYNGGASFSRYQNVSQVGEVRFDPLNRSVLWIAGGASIYYSSNYGATFTEMSNIWDLHNFQIDPNYPSMAFDVSDQGIYETQNLGKTWKSINGNLENYLTYGVSASSNGQELFVTMQDYGSLVSHTGGVAWSYGSLANPLWSREGSVGFIDKANASRVFVYSPYGYLEASFDGAQNFEKVINFSTSFYTTDNIFAQSVTHPSIIYFGSQLGIYNSTDGGLSWHIWPNSPQQIMSIALSPNGNVFASNNSGLFLFSSGKWIKSENINSAAASISVNPSNSNQVIAVVGLHSESTAYMSSDGGLEFSEINVSFDPWYGGMWYSETPGGASFQMYFLNTSGYPLLALTNHGAYISLDLGKTWHNISYNLLSGEITGYSFENDTLFLSTYGEGVVAIRNFSVSELPGTLSGHLENSSDRLLIENQSVQLHASFYRVYLKPGDYNITVENNITGKSNYFNIDIASMANIYFNGTLNSLQVKYPVAFHEENLPPGTVWYVNLSNGQSFSSTTSTISFNEPNGTYTFTATNLSDYYTTTSHFSVTINGKNVTETVTYYHWAYITGTLSPGNATLTINGHAVSVSSTGSFNVSVTNGTYDVVASESGYQTYYNNFTLNSGNEKNLTIYLKAVSKPSSISPLMIYGALGAAVVVVIGAAVAFFVRRK